MELDTYYAHSANGAGQRHLLAEHLTSVGRIAADFAANFPWAAEAKLAGVLHDLGKYGDLFQARLRGEESGLDHWSQGAWFALLEYRAVAACLAIQGHHVGLQAADHQSLGKLNPSKLKTAHPLKLRLSDDDIERLKSRLQQDGVNVPVPERIAITVNEARNTISAMLDVRMLFSCLVDADFLDTEAHFRGDANGKKYRDSGPSLDIDRARAALDEHVSEKIRAHSEADTSVKQARDALWQAVAQAAGDNMGLFTLTAPTGSGKTLAMLKFALEHAARHRLKRIILVIPFLTIIEQTSAVYRAVFSAFNEHFVLEHHSLAGMGNERAVADAEGESNQAERFRRLLSENWDAPIVVTTNVQLLESLFSNRPSACRKLHRLAESVILFDEAQTLPVPFAVPTLAALSHLSRVYRSSVVFATATQPAFDHLHDAVKKHSVTGWSPREIVADHALLYGNLRRTHVHWPKENESIAWEALAENLKEHEQALCVVNLKRHALTLLELLENSDSVFHLSTNLCPAHRQAVLATVRERLNKGDHCRLVSTQCVEAGVDVDFPIVYRALAPLDAIAQAAGRCNREGRLKDALGNTKMGEVYVFDPEEAADRRKRFPTFTYFQAATVTSIMLKAAGDGGLDIHDPQTFRDYYRRLYDISQPEKLKGELDEAINAADFPKVAQQYRLINEDTIMVLVPYEKQIEEYRALRDELDAKGLSANWMRRAQRLSVALYRPKLDHPAWGVLIPAKLARGGVSDEWYVIEGARYYDERLGLKLPDSMPLLIG